MIVEAGAISNQRSPRKALSKTLRNTYLGIQLIALIIFVIVSPLSL